VLLLPFTGSEDQTLKNTYFKQTETGTPGYYSVIKKDSVRVELTCSERVAFHQYTFPKGQPAKVYADLQHGLRFVFDENNAKPLVTDSDVNIENDSTISGYCSTENWVKRKYFFVISFDHPFDKYTSLPKANGEMAPKFIFEFDESQDCRLKVKISLSSVSVEGAKLNLKTEIPHWDFDKVKTDNLACWNTFLSRIDIEAPPKQKEIFYTSLYHLFLQPSNIADVDGKYRGADDKISQAPNHEYYSTLSIWDIYRGAFPLLQLIAAEKIDGIVNSMLLHHKAAGFLPIWTAWGQDNYCMIGNHAIPMILSAYNNGFTGFDKNEALKAMVETSTIGHINSDWELYNKYGYYPFDKLENEAVSRTLESGYDDWCVAEMASKLGNKEVADEFYKRSNYYQNLFESGTAFFRGKDSNGNWRTPFDPLMATSPLNNPGDYTEANAWQYFWTPAQHDVPGLINLLGGKDKFMAKLNQFFTIEAENPNKFLGQEAMIGQYAHGNEPGHHVVYLYAFSDEPETGQKYIHQIINNFHNNTPDGMIGNDDCGQMSSWYVLSTLGFYPVNPANGEFVFGSPQVKMATINLPDERKFVIEAINFSDKNICSKIKFLNDKRVDTPFITYRQIMNGGTLQFEMINQ
jgi:predicted alpha-1,2-mannosidase